jgi:predicted Zn-dependent peptidase
MSARRSGATLVCAALASTLGPRPLARADAGPAPAAPLAVERYALANQLELVLAPDPTVTSVVVELWLGAGAADEDADEHGAAHLLERAVGAEADDARLDDAGGWGAASTSTDRIAFVAQVPAAQLPLALWLQGRRLAALTRPISAAELARARAEIVDERQRSYLDRPYGAAELAAPALVWPADHPYAHAVIGDGDGAAPTAAAIERFRAAHVRPGAATLIVCGGFAPARVRALVEAQLGALAPSPRLAPSTVSAPGPRAHRAQAAWPEARAAAAVTMTWRAPPQFGADAAPLELGVAILGSGPASRLARALIDRAHLATELELGYDARRQGGEVQLLAIAADGVSAARLATAIDAALADLRRAPPTADELVRARMGHRAQALAQLENLPSRADALARWVTALDRTDFVTGDQARFAAVTRAEVTAAIATWLGTDAAVVATFDRPIAQRPGSGRAP